MGIAHCSQSLLARASPVRPDKPPVLCRRGPAEFKSQELKTLLQLHPSRTSSITLLGALWSEATVHPHPLPTARRRVWLAFVLSTSQTSVEPGHWGPFISFALRSCSAIPYWAFPIHHCWQFHLCPLLGISSRCLWIRGFFPHSSKELVTFTAWYWNLWTEPSHSSAKLDRFQLPHSRKLVILQLSLFSCLNHPMFLRLCPQWQGAAWPLKQEMAVAKGHLQSHSKQEGTSQCFKSVKQSYSIWLLPAVSQYLSLTPVYYCSSESQVKFFWLPGWSFLMQTWCNVPACPIPGYMTSPEPQQTAAPPRCAPFSTTGLLVLFRLSYTLESITQYFTGLQNCPTDKQWNHTYTEISKGTVMFPKPVLTAFNLPCIQNSSPSLLVHWSHTILHERVWCQIFRAAQHGLLTGTIQTSCSFMQQWGELSKMDMCKHMPRLFSCTGITQ